jgi:uncharacterized protein YuzE
MTLKVDEKADALYLRLDDSKIIESEEVSPAVILDFNADNQVVGVEILYLSKRSPKRMNYNFRAINPTHQNSKSERARVSGYL